MEIVWIQWQRGVPTADPIQRDLRVKYYAGVLIIGVHGRLTAFTSLTQVLKVNGIVQLSSICSYSMTKLCAYLEVSTMI